MRELTKRSRPAQTRYSLVTAVVASCAPLSLVELRVLRHALMVLVAIGLSDDIHAQVAARETLQLTATLPSPWGSPLTPAYANGSTLHLAPKVFNGPGPLQCVGGTYQFLRSPPEGLFEGNLPAPANRSAAALGLPDNIVTQRVSCANGGFDLHRAADGRAWIGLDNAVLKFQSSGMTSSPEAIVQSLLIQHFASGMALSADSIAGQRQWLSAGLSQQFEKWFERIAKSDEVPELNGDPFTDSQEAPERFELAPSRVRGERADVVVSFSREHAKSYPVTFSLVRVNGDWRIDELLYRDGTRLTTLLSK